MNISILSWWFVPVPFAFHIDTNVISNSGEICCCTQWGSLAREQGSALSLVRAINIDYLCFLSANRGLLRIKHLNANVTSGKICYRLNPFVPLSAPCLCFPAVSEVMMNLPKESRIHFPLFSSIIMLDDCRLQPGPIYQDRWHISLAANPHSTEAHGIGEAGMNVFTLSFAYIKQMLFSGTL